MTTEETPDSTKKTAAIIGAVAGIAGSFLPWLTVTFGFGTVEVAGTTGDGKFTLGLGIVLLLAVLNNARGRAATWLALICVCLTAYELQHVGSALVGSIGYGLYICMAGFVVALWATVSMPKAEPAVTLPEGEE